MLPDIPAVDRPFDYEIDLDVPVGTVVRMPFSGRRVRGWVLETSVVPEPGRDLLTVTKVVGRGPDPEVIDLCRWAAQHWVGRLVTMLRLATPDKVVPLSGPDRQRPPGGSASRATALVVSKRTGSTSDPDLDEVLGSLLRSDVGVAVVRTTAVMDNSEIALLAAEVGQSIIVTPSPPEADRIVRKLRSSGLRAARWPQDWAMAAAGATVVGTRGAVFAPAPDLAAIVVLDEHDPLLQNEGSPTWNAREVAVRRALSSVEGRDPAACLLVSPTPSLEAYRAQGSSAQGSSAQGSSAQGHRTEGGLDQNPSVGTVPSEVGFGHLRVQNLIDDPAVLSPMLTLSTSRTRDGWAPIIVIDRRGEDMKRTGLFASQSVELMREAVSSGERVLCVLNRTGRARLLACRSCSTVARCHVCDSAVIMPEGHVLVCPGCGTTRPPVCVECGSVALANLRLGVSRAREELEALLRVPVGEVTAATAIAHAGTSSNDPTEGVIIGTSTALRHRSPGGTVIFLDFDQELLAPRYRGAEDAMRLVIDACRAVGGRRSGGRIVIQTRIPEHQVILSVLKANPSPFSESELKRRDLLGLPPSADIALVGGEAAPEFMARLGEPENIEVLSAGEGTWSLRSRVPGLLAEVLSNVDRPPGRLRLQVNPSQLSR